MSTQQKASPPIMTHRDGAVFAKVWRNVQENGDAFYNVTVGRTFTDKQSGEIRESRSLSGTDILKAQTLLGESYNTISQERAMDRAHAQKPELSTQEPEPAPQGLQAQRDAALNNAAPAQGTTAPDTIKPSHTPEQ